MAKWLYWITILSALPAHAVSLDEAIQGAVQKSNYVKAQEVATDIASNDRWRRFLLHEPSFQLTNSDDGAQESYSLSLTTPFPAKSLAYMELDRAKAKAESAEVQAKRQDLAKLITDTYLDCASGLALLDIQKTALSDLETMFDSLTAMYESGHASQAERIGTDLQMRQTRSEVRAAADKTDVACHRWQQLMGDDRSLPDKVPDDLSHDTLEMLGLKSADVSRGEAALKLANVNDDLRWWSVAPDLTWSYQRNHYTTLTASPILKEWTTTYGVSVTVPIFFLFDESIEAKRAKAQNEFDRHNAEVAVLKARNDVEDAAQEFQRDKKRIHELHDKDIALAEALVDSTFAAYKSGKLGFAELMLSRKTLWDLRTQEVQLKMAAVQARLKCLLNCEDARPSERAM